MSMPLVSVLIPCYNSASWLEATLKSALAQSYKDIEIIVVNDGSTDKSLAIARQYEARGVRIFDQPNQGASAARNRALQEARGDFIQFLDADDLLATDKIALQLRLAETAGLEHAFCATWSRFTSSIADADFTPQPLCADFQPVDWVITKFELNAMMHPAAWLIPRTLVEKAGPWNESLSLDDDGEYFTRIVLASQGVRFCRNAVSYYRSGRSGSLSQSKSEQAWTAAFCSLELAVNHLLKAEDSPRTRHACATVLQRYIYEAYPRAIDSRSRASRLVTKLGGSALQPDGGPRFQLARRVLGWRLAKRLQHIF